MNCVMLRLGVPGGGRARQGRDHDRPSRLTGRNRRARAPGPPAASEWFNFNKLKLKFDSLAAAPPGSEWNLQVQVPNLNLNSPGRQRHWRPAAEAPAAATPSRWTWRPGTVARPAASPRHGDEPESRVSDKYMLRHARRDFEPRMPGPRLPPPTEAPRLSYYWNPRPAAAGPGTEQAMRTTGQTEISVRG